MRRCCLLLVCLLLLTGCGRADTQDVSSFAPAEGDRLVIFTSHKETIYEPILKEFEQRTGYFPSSAEYKAIEAAYMEFDGDKDEFCKAYKKNANGIAERIRREVNAAAFKESRQHTADLTRRDIEIERLKKQFEREQEWKPYEDADAVSQADYDELATSGGTDKMTDDEAKALLYNWYGFAKEMVVILRTAPIYEINRHRQLREVGAVDRAPLYNATDWNYIRFTCGRMSYELYNDTLRPCAS